MHRQNGFRVSLVIAALVILSASQLLIRGVKGAASGVSFAPPKNYTVGLEPFNNVLADFNGDKILDMAVANSDPGVATISVLLGKGDGTFVPSATYPVGNEPTALLAADFNGDHIMDLAVANELGRGANQCLSVLIGNGDGTFKPAVNYAGGRAPRGIAKGDFNNDGITDLVIANNDGDDVSIYLGNGDGTFQPAVDYPSHTHPKAVAVGDFNRDGNDDLAVANHDTSDVSILFGDGKGHFAAPVNYSVGLNPRDIHVGNLRGGVNEKDLVTADGGSTTISVLLDNGDGTFQPSVHYPAGSSPRWVILDDFNGDGILDAAASDYAGASVDVLLGKGDGTFGKVFPFAVGAQPTGIQSGDLNGDGKPDLVVTIGGPTTAPSNLVSVLLNVSLTISPIKLAFGNQALGTTSPSFPVTLTNAAPTFVAISSIQITGADPGDFRIMNNTCGNGIAANSSCTINVAFAPQAVNSRTATLSVTDSAPGSPQTVALQGVGTTAGLSPSRVSFRPQKVGTTSSPVVITLTNVSFATTLTINMITITGANPGDFPLTNNACGTSLPPRQSCTMSVAFKPTATGLRRAAVSVSDNAAGSPQNVPLTGSGQ